MYTVYCFHPAGASGSVFTSRIIDGNPAHNPLVDFCHNNDIKLVPVTLSGRVANERMESMLLAEEVKEVFKKHFMTQNSPNYVLIGHSMGCFVIFLILKLCWKHQLHLPRGVFLSASVSPLLPSSQRPWRILRWEDSDERVKQSMREWGVPEVIFQERYWSVFGLPLKRDMVAVSEFEASSPCVAKDVQICAVSLKEDAFIKHEHVQQNKEAFAGCASFKIIELPGPHNVLHSAIHREKWLNTCVEFLTKLGLDNKETPLANEAVSF